MDIVGNMENLVTRLNEIREKYGEDKYREAVEDVVRLGLRQGGQPATFVRSAFNDIVDIAKIEASINQKTAPEQLMAEMLKAQVPGIQTQAQFNSFMACFDALRITLQAIFTGSKEGEAEGRKALDQALEMAKKVTEVGNKLKDVPEAATSAASEDFKNPPSEFHEFDTQKRLMLELSTIGTKDLLANWYEKNRADLDRVKSPQLRNVLFDAIREKRNLMDRP